MCVAGNDLFPKDRRACCESSAQFGDNCARRTSRTHIRVNSYARVGTCILFISFLETPFHNFCIQLQEHRVDINVQNTEPMARMGFKSCYQGRWEIARWSRMLISVPGTRTITVFMSVILKIFLRNKNKKIKKKKRKEKKSRSACRGLDDTTDELNR